MRDVADVDHPFFRRLLDAIPDLVYVVDESDRLVTLNETGRERLGYDEADLRGRSLSTLLAPADRDFLPADGRAMVDCPDRRRELDLVTADGDRLPHVLRAVTVTDPAIDGRYRVGVAREITDRQVRERDLERYETVVDSLDDGVYTLDEDMTFSFVNDRLCELFGRSREEILGTDPRELFVDESELETAAAMRRAVMAGETGTGTVEARTETPDGTRRELESRYRPLDEPVDGAFPGTAGVIRDVTERNRRERDLARQRALLQGILNTIPDVVFAFDPEGEPLGEEFLLDEFAGYTADELADIDPLDLVPPEERDGMADLIASVLETGETASRETALLTKDGERIPYEFRGTRLEEDGEVLGVVGTGRDVTERVERERALEQRRDELATLSRLTELLLEITRELVDVPSRRAVERTVCDRLAESPLFRFAWIGERELDGSDVISRVSAGDDGSVAARVARDGEGPVGEAIHGSLRTGRVQVANVDPAASGGGADADERVGDSVAAVPLVHGETVYGVCCVHATRPDAFNERERAGFRILGETVGFVIDAIKRRKLVVADAVTELEFHVSGDGSPLVAASDALDCDLAVDGHVNVDGRWIVYLDADGASPDDLVAYLTGCEPIADARVVANAANRRRVEVVLSASAPFDAASSVGATVRTVSASGGNGRVVVEIPADADVREAVELLARAVPGSQLVARRERDRAPVTRAEPGGVLDGLTDRQHEALRVAYRAGYYEWPRGSNAEEVADTLDVASPTLHAHLRKAEGRLLGRLFDDR